MISTLIEIETVDYVQIYVTAEVVRNGERLVVVYVPTMPNPTSGFALFFREDEVLESGMSVEEAVKFVVSGGVVVSSGTPAA